MKTRLQYAYSITIFIGVLASSYLMMNQDSSRGLPQQLLQGSSMTKEATMMDPVVNQLFEFEEALSKQYKDEESQPKRIPTKSEE